MSDELAQQILAELRDLRAQLSDSGRKLPDRPMSPKEFGAVVGKSERTVRRWIDRGKLKARREGGTTLITPVNAQRFLNPPVEEAWR